MADRLDRRLRRPRAAGHLRPRHELPALPDADAAGPHPGARCGQLDDRPHRRGWPRRRHRPALPLWPARSPRNCRGRWRRRAARAALPRAACHERGDRRRGSQPERRTVRANGRSLGLPISGGRHATCQRCDACNWTRGRRDQRDGARHQFRGHERGRWHARVPLWRRHGQRDLCQWRGASLHRTARHPRPRRRHTRRRRHGARSDESQPTGVLLGRALYIHAARGDAAAACAVK